MKTKEVNNCRICHSEDVEPLFSLGEQYVSNFLSEGDDPGEKVPIELMFCRNCTLVYLKHTAPQEILYRRYYWYRSGVTQTMRNALADITHQVEALVPLQEGDIVLDIGSNDGTLLRSYRNKDIITVGVEPANNLENEGRKGLDHFIHDFWLYDTYKEHIGKPAKAITAIGMFYDLDDPNQFIADIAAALAPDGLFIAQLMCLRDMYELNDVGNLAHEHLEFYSLRSLDYIFGKCGMEIFDIDFNSVNGRSTRLFVRHSETRHLRPAAVGAKSRLENAYAAEEPLHDPETFKTMFNAMEENKRKTVEFIENAVEEGKIVWVYGASTKGNTVLQYYGLTSDLIVGAAERSPEKWGLHTVGTKIPIYSEEDARKADPDYFLVLPYAFLSEFVKREHEWRDRGGRFIVPLPELRIV
jgi:NDP-4-keto-2,6-dideoxyhexose 3-C-methyltransferase